LFYSDALIESGARIKVKADLCAAKSPLVAGTSMQMHRWIQVSDFAKIYQRITTTAQIRGAKTPQPFSHPECRRALIERRAWKPAFKVQ
jgi:NAD dependent epimerase/dehydratase family enzyme